MISSQHLAKWLLGGSMLLLTAMPLQADAASPVSINLNGRPLPVDVPPVIEQNVTLVPLRALLTPLGAEFAWDSSSQTVTASLEGVLIQAQVGRPTARVNGEAVPLAMPVTIQEGRTLIPLRFFAEEFGFDVDWEAESQTVHVYSGRPGGGVFASRSGFRRKGAQVVEWATEQIGASYAWGGTNPVTGFDCSGFAYYLASLAGVELPRSSHEQFWVGLPVEIADLAPGDFVFFATYDDGPSHVGIYDGNGGFIHAQSQEVGVVRTSLWNPWWSARYLGGRRVFR